MIVPKLRAVRVHSPRWWRGPARSEGEWIVLDAVNAELYEPMSERDLLFDLADIHRPDEAVAFVRKYGLLLHGPGANDPRERFSEILGTSLTLAGILHLYRHIRAGMKGDEDALDALRALAGNLVADGHKFIPPPETDEEFLVAASQFLAYAVSEGLKGIEERLDSDVEWGVGPGGTAGSPDGFRLAPEPPHLLALAYHALALHVSMKAPIGTCADCGRHFPQEDPRQQYCTPRCASRARRKRWRERHPLPLPGDGSAGIVDNDGDEA